MAHGSEPYGSGRRGNSQMSADVSLLKLRIRAAKMYLLILQKGGDFFFPILGL